MEVVPGSVGFWRMKGMMVQRVEQGKWFLVSLPWRENFGNGFREYQRSVGNV